VLAEPKLDKQSCMIYRQEIWIVVEKNSFSSQSAQNWGIQNTLEFEKIAYNAS
jgi:hypothetical protein